MVLAMSMASWGLGLLTFTWKISVELTAEADTMEESWV